MGLLEDISVLPQGVPQCQQLVLVGTSLPEAPSCEPREPCRPLEAVRRTLLLQTGGLLETTPCACLRVHIHKSAFSKQENKLPFLCACGQGWTAAELGLPALLCSPIPLWPSSQMLLPGSCPHFYPKSGWGAPKHFGSLLHPPPPRHTHSGCAEKPDFSAVMAEAIAESCCS